MNTFASVALAVSLLAYAPYIYTMLRAGKKQNPVTWFSFLLVNTVLLGASIVAGKPNYPAMAYEIGILLVFIIALSQSRGSFTSSDQRILSIVILAIVAWFFAGDRVAVLLAIFAMCVGTWPLWQTLWNNPESQPRLPFFMWFVGSLIEFVSYGPTDTWEYTPTALTTAYSGQQLSVLLIGLRSFRSQRI